MKPQQTERDRIWAALNAQANAITNLLRDVRAIQDRLDSADQDRWLDEPAPVGEIATPPRHTLKMRKRAQVADEELLLRVGEAYATARKHCHTTYKCAKWIKNRLKLPHAKTSIYTWLRRYWDAPADGTIAIAVARKKQGAGQ